MSPPCQPFTTTINSSQRDVSDPRTASFVHLLSLLVQLSPDDQQPTHLLLENVPGFFGSTAHQQLLSVLQQLGGQHFDVLMCPSQLGIPYRRLRHYTLARIASTRPFSPAAAQQLQQLHPDQPDPPQLLPGHQQVQLQQFLEFCWSQQTLPLEQVDDAATQQQVAAYALPCSRVSRYYRVLDVVTPLSSACNCFTKGYGKNVAASGSYVLPAAAAQQMCEQDSRGRWHFTRDPYSCSSDGDAGTNSGSAAAERQLPPAARVRCFTPGEVARLQGFPSSFCFPPGTSNRQAYQLLGNSVSIDVVAFLAALLLEDVTVQ